MDSGGHYLLRPQAKSKFTSKLRNDSATSWRKVKRRCLYNICVFIFLICKWYTGIPAVEVCFYFPKQDHLLWLYASRLIRRTIVYFYIVNTGTQKINRYDQEWFGIMPISMSYMTQHFINKAPLAPTLINYHVYFHNHLSSDIIILINRSNTLCVSIILKLLTAAEQKE